MNSLSGLLSRAVDLHQAGDPAAAEQLYRQLLRQQPEHADALHLLGVAIFQQQRPREALDWLLLARQVNPEAAVYSTNLAGVYRALRQYGHAVEMAREAVRLAPADAGTWFSLGAALKETGAADEAIDCLSRAIELQPDHRDAHVDRAFTRLLSGRNLAAGWREAIWRWPGARLPDGFAIPVWAGESLAGKSLLIRAEQGLGDQLMAASCLPELIVAAGRCHFECDPRLVDLLARSFPNAHVSGPLSDPPAVDLQTYSGSMLEFLRPELSAFPQHAGYLTADPRLREFWRQRLRELPPGLRVGISWTGGANAARREVRSVPAPNWQPLVQLPNVQLCCVQYGVTADEVQEFSRGFGGLLHFWPECRPTVDQDGFAALLSELDLTVTVDNSTAHLAGALGQPVWNLLSYAADCRWFLHREDSPWYPAMRLFRQTADCRWESVISRVCRELRNGTIRPPAVQHP